MTMGHSIGMCSFGLYFAFIVLCYPVFGQRPDHGSDLDVTADLDVIGSNANLNCSVYPEYADVRWIFQGQTIGESKRTILVTEEIKLDIRDRDGNQKKKKILRLTVKDVTDADAGTYTCVAELVIDLGEVVNKSATLDLRFEGSLVKKTNGPLLLNASKPSDMPVTMYCLFEVYKKPDEVRWYRKGKSGTPQARLPISIGLKQIISTFDLDIITAEANGTYVCEVEDKVTNKYIQGEVDIIVYDKPKFVSFNAIPVNTTQIYINWTVNTYNSPVVMYSLFICEGHEGCNTSYRLHTRDRILPNATSFLINGLHESTEYKFILEVKTAGWETTGLWIDTNVVKTLDKEPVFVPNITITSVTIGWTPPPEDIADLKHYYIFEVSWLENENKSHVVYHPRDSGNLSYVFEHLDPQSTYVIRMRACCDYTNFCGPWSKEMMTATATLELDGISARQRRNLRLPREP